MAAPTVTAEKPSPTDEGQGLYLVVLGPGLNASHRLQPGDSLLIGRAEDAPIRLLDPRASRQHARLHVGAGVEGAAVVEIEELGSANGTRVRDHLIRVAERVALRPGDAVTIGDTVLTLQGRAPTVFAATGATSPEASIASATPVLGEASDGPSIRTPIIRHPAMVDLYALAKRIAVSDLNVLILGETGVGKDLLAEAVHVHSRRSGPLLSINGAALTESLLESELFGYERGAFTGASQGKAGLLEAAQGGSLFLDEVGELSLGLQAKLLRAIESKRILRVGSTQPRPIDVRFIAATNRDLEAEIAQKSFRQDLYFRLNGVSLVIPPLRARVCEIEPLARHFAAEAARRLGRTAPEIAPEVLALLRDHPWPGNIRELRNLIELAALLSVGDRIEIEHFPGERIRAATLKNGREEEPRPESEATLSWRERLAAQERDSIREALLRCGGNQTRAAELLGMPRRTFCSRLKDLGLQRSRT